MLSTFSSGKPNNEITFVIPRFISVKFTLHFNVTYFIPSRTEINKLSRINKLNIFCRETFHLNIVTCISVVREKLGKNAPEEKNSWPTIGKGIPIARQRAVTSFVNNTCRVFYVVRAYIRSSGDCSRGFVRKTSFKAVQ
jgi:hypothetical protein